MDFLTPELFDMLVIANIASGLLIAGRRFISDLRRPLPAEAPDWAHQADASTPPPSSNS